MSGQIDFTKIALGLLPPGSRPSIVDLRQQFATTLQRVTGESIESFRRDNMPAEIASAEASVKKLQQDLAARSAALAQEREAFRQIVAGHLEFLTAVEHWIEWCGGNGNPDDQAGLWVNVRQSWERYRKLRP